MNQKGFISLVATIIIVLAVLAAGAYYYGRGSGKVITENRDVTTFSKISLKGIGNLKISQGETESLRIEAEDNLMKKIETEVRGDTLHIGFKLAWPFWSVWPTKDVNFYVTVKNLSDVSVNGSGKIDFATLALQDVDLRVSGSGTITGTTLTGRDVNIDISGSGKVRLGLNVEKIVSHISGSGDFSLNGTATDQEISISGSGKYLAKDLVSQNVKVDISGSGKSEVNAQKSLTVKISGSGSVSYFGQPVIDQSISGSGKIERLTGNPTTNTNINSNTNTAANVNYLPPPSSAYANNPKYCEKTSDCIAVDHPLNHCYKAYYNIYAQTEIEAYRNQTGAMILDCPFFGPAICENNVCTGQPQT
ncbi:MAG: head GIN domain-containing protein [Patescibacteria group bacterium]